LCALVSIVLLVTSGTFALAETSVKPVVLNYEQLSELVKAHNLGYQKDLQEIRRAELSIKEIESDLGDLYQLYREGLDVFNAIEAQYSILFDAEENLSKLHDGLGGRLKQHVYLAQKQFIGHYIIALDVEIAERELDALEKELLSAKYKMSRGLVTQNEVRNTEKSVEAQKRTVKAIQTKADDNLEALAKDLGIEDPITLEGLPAIDFERITNRDLKSDLDAYIQAAAAVAEKTMKAANERYAKSKSSINWYVYTMFVKDYEIAKKEAEKEFPKVYRTLRDAYDEMVNSTELIDAQKNFDKDEAQFARGIISQNKLLSSERALQNAENRQTKLEIQIWLQLMEYEYSLLKF